MLKVCGATKNQRPCEDAPPRPLKDPEPKYSKEARKKKIQGTVVLTLIVDRDGLPQNIRLAGPVGRGSVGYGLDEEAIKTVKKWRFKPATMDGQPVAVMINVQVDFRLY